MRPKEKDLGRDQRTQTNSLLLCLHRVPQRAKACTNTREQPNLAASRISGNVNAKPSSQQVAWSPADACADQRM